MCLLRCNFIVSEEDLYFPALPLAPMIVYNLIEPSTFFHLKAFEVCPFYNVFLRRGREVCFHWLHPAGS